MNSAAQLILLAAQLSIALMVFGIGLTSRDGDLLFLFRYPGLLLRSLLAMNIVMPLFALMVAMSFDLNPALRLALIAIALAPVPPILPKKQIGAGGTASYVLALLAIAALIAIVFIPVALAALGRLVSHPAHISMSAVAKVVGITVLIPLLVGAAVRRIAPDAAAKIARPVSMLAIVLLALAVLIILFVAWRGIVALIGDFTLVAIAMFVVVGLAVGHALGGPDPDNRTVLALATATRHPGIAVTIVLAVNPQNKAAIAAVLLYLIAATVFSVPYVVWRKRAHAHARAT